MKLTKLDATNFEFYKEWLYTGWFPLPEDGDDRYENPWTEMANLHCLGDKIEFVFLHNATVGYFLRHWPIIVGIQVHSKPKTRQR